jgi:hypothetical protein
MPGDVPDPEVLREAGRLVERLLTDYTVEEWEQASFFVIECADPETGHNTLHGRFVNVVAATAYADEWEQELNGGMPEGEARFRCTVRPVREVGA